ncbi:carbohydrate kinase family protein [Haloechinothrix salitolerans]|uniref:Carbohydrate kinase family protein n=1 Tax=Haloechinothrix salitolerans TaxID=926830 RepID=A0ABW2BV26_9PSEU
MRIALTGSIATDHLMSFPGSFSEQLMADHLDQISLSFLIDELEVRRGGVAANIAFGLGRLGLGPILVGAAGEDFADYSAWLTRSGVDTDNVLISSTNHTARFVCTTDNAQNQIASFYPGAMTEAREIDLTRIADAVGGFDLVVISPNDPDAMVRHTRQCRDLGVPFVADPSQQLARADGELVRELVNGATYLFTNEYESMLLKQKSGWTSSEVLARVGTWVITHGENGATISRNKQPTLVVPAVPPTELAEPTGVGDAFRAGFIAGIAWEFDDTTSAQLGATMATLALEVVGTQEYDAEHAEIVDRLRVTFGTESAELVKERLAAQSALTVH